MTCLIVENEPTVRDVIAAVLAPLAPRIVECADGADALAAYETCRPDVVLMDIAMANLDGLSATRAIIAAHPSARVLIVTNFDDEDLREAARRAGAAGYVLKENLLVLVPLVQSLI
jgi:DNA-binding NarL/FixJ family response regulator